MLLKTDVLKEDKVLQEYFEGVPFCWEKTFSQLFFLCVCVGSELLYSNCSLDC